MIPPIILDSGADTTDATSKLTASVTTGEDNLSFVVVHNARASAPTLPTIIDANRTWDQIATIEYDPIATPTKRLTLFRCMVEATGDLTIDFGGTTQTSITYSILDWGEVNNFPPLLNGGVAVGQIVTGAVDAAAALSLAVTGYLNPNYVTFGVMARALTGEDVVEGVDFIELSDLPIDTPDSQMQGQWRPQNVATVDWSWTSAANAAGIAVEIKSAEGPQPPVLIPITPGVALTPWVEISRRVSPTWAVQTTYHASVDYALNDPSSYYGGRKEPDVLAFEPMFRELSDESGMLRDAELSVTLQDVNRTWRTRNASDVFKGQALIVRSTDDATRKAEGAPKIIARQLMKTPTFNADGSITFSGRDRIAALLSGTTNELLKVPQIQITRAHFLNIASDDEYLNFGMPEIYGSHLNTTLGFGGPIPVLPIDYPYILDSGLQYGLGLICVGACQSVTELRVNNEVVDTANNNYFRPGSTSWNNQAILKVGGVPVTYFTLQSGLRITCVFIFGGQWSAVKSGQKRLTVAGHGMENSANGDGTGTVITSGPSQLLHWLKNRVFGSQWTTPLAAPVDPDGTPYIDTGSFTAAETVQAARLGGGYPLRWRVGPERITPDEQVAKVVRSMGAQIAQTWEGSLLLRQFNRAQTSTLSLAPHGTATMILKGSVEPLIDDAVHANEINYEYAELYDQSGMEISGAAVRDEVSCTKYGRVYDSELLSLPAVGDAAVAYDVAYHALKARTEPPHRYRARASAAGINLELGKTVAVTHPFGIQSSAGVAAAKFWIEGIGYDIKSGDVQLVLLDQTQVANSLVITKAVTSITRTGTTATVTQTAHGYTTGRAYTIAGADQVQYNGTKIIAVTGANTYTFGVDSAAVTPATGTITASTTDLGRMQIKVEKVDVKDKETKTGPIVTDEFDLGGSRDTALAPAANTDVDMVEARIAKIEKSDTGKRRVVARVWLDSGGSGTDVTPKIKTQSGSTIATGTAENDTSPTMYEIILQDFKAVPAINLLVAGTEDYKLTGRRNNTTNTFTMWGQINIL